MQVQELYAVSGSGGSMRELLSLGHPGSADSLSAKSSPRLSGYQPIAGRMPAFPGEKSGQAVRGPGGRINISKY